MARRYFGILGIARINPTSPPTRKSPLISVTSGVLRITVSSMYSVAPTRIVKRLPISFLLCFIFVLILLLLQCNPLLNALFLYICARVLSFLCVSYQLKLH